MDARFKIPNFYIIILWRVAELSESCDPSKYSPLGCARFDVSLFCQDDGMFASFFMDCYGLHFYLGLGNRNLAYIELPWDKKSLWRIYYCSFCVHTPHYYKQFF